MSTIRGNKRPSQWKRGSAALHTISNTAPPQGLKPWHLEDNEVKSEVRVSKMWSSALGFLQKERRQQGVIDCSNSTLFHHSHSLDPSSPSQTWYMMLYLISG